MAGKLIEFPRKLEWAPLESWVGVVKGSKIIARVDRVLDGTEYQWFAWSDGAVLGGGLAVTLEEGKELARTAIEASVMVVRQLPQKGS